MKHNITLTDGMLMVDSGVALTGVTIDMLTNLREVYISLSELCEALDLKDEEGVAMKHEQAKALLAYLRASKNFGKGEK